MIKDEKESTGQGSGFWEGKKVLVTGGSGFIGSHLVEELLKLDADVTVTTYSGRDDLANLAHVKDKVTVVSGNLMDTDFAMDAVKGKDIVMHLAARVAGVQVNSTRPATMFRDNIAMFMPVIEAARKNNVERMLTVSSACVYPRDCTIPIPEDEGFKGEPDPANEGYGWAKRMEEYLSKAYHKEYGMKVAITRPFNTFGPRDNFALETAHVIPSLIVKALSGSDKIVVWGDGTTTRSFIFCKDFARGLIKVTENHADSDPVNIGTPEETSIKNLAEMIVRLTGSKTRIEFDPSKPGGQPRRVCDTKKAKELTGFEAKVSLEEGLKETIEWYKNNVLKS